MSPEVQGNEQMALQLGGPARVRGRPGAAQRLDAGQGGGAAHQQDPSAHPLRPEQDPVSDVHQVPSGRDQSKLAFTKWRAPPGDDL